MHPILFKIGDFTIYTYGFFIALGSYLAFIYLYKQLRKQFSVSYEQSNMLFLISIVTSIIGGKLFMLLEAPSYYWAHPSAFFDRGGFVFYGALITGVSSLLWYIRRLKAPMWGVLDVVAGMVCIAHAIGRLGCLSAGCCHGTPTDHWWGITFTNPICAAEPLNTPLHPTQLYEFLWVGLIFLLLQILHRHKKFNGQQFLIYLILYGIGRSIIEIYRGDEERGYLIGHFSTSQVISAFVVAWAIIMYVRLMKKQKKLVPPVKA